MNPTNANKTVGAAFAAILGALGVALATTAPQISGAAFALLAKLAFSFAAFSATMSAYFQREANDPTERIIYGSITVLGLIVGGYALYVSWNSLPTLLKVLIIGLPLAAMTYYAASSRKRTPA